MFHALSSSVTQPQDLRRRQLTRRDLAFQHSSQWNSAAMNSEIWNDSLDLSMHHPSAPFSMHYCCLADDCANVWVCNRFDVFAAPAPAPTRDRVHQYDVPSPRRRIRYGRGTKEAKKRRDTRRSKRKFAVQLFDEQLSRGIDETLIKANIHRPEPINMPTLTPMLPTTSVAQSPSCSALSRYTPTPPRLPPLDLSSLSFHNLPNLPAPSHSPSVSPLPPVCKGVPSWCPHIPSRMQNGAWSDNIPMFWDLSSLAEPKSSPPKESKSQDVQLWKGAMNFQPKRQQSRFFPPPTTPKPVVQLPPTGCKLHWSERVSQDPVTTAWNSSAATPDLVLGTVERIMAVMQGETPSEQPMHDPPSAANLWHILASALDQERKADHAKKTSNWSEDNEEMGGVSLDPIFKYENTPTKLEGSGVPYLHGNSLTGPSNETAAYHTNGHVEDDIEVQRLHDSAIYLAELFAPLDDSPIDSLASPHELAAMPWPLTPRAQTPLPTYDSLASLPQTSSPLTADTNTDSDDLVHSTDHFKSEQQLFDPAEIPLPDSPIESECDLAMFLSMGHVEDCWCRDCNEAPEMGEAEPVTPFSEHEDQDGWMTWSSAESNTTSVDAISLADNDDCSDEQICEPIEATEWDELFPQLPDCPQEPVLDVEEAFVGYYDDGVAYAKQEREEDYDWMWSF